MIPDRRPQSAWNLNIKAKLHLINVCRNWYQAGVSILYADIAVYSIIQLCALVSTLRASSSLAGKVSCIQLCCLVPKPYTRIFENIMHSLPSLCPHLTRVSIQESFVPDVGVTRASVERILSSLFCSTSLTHLEVHDSIPFGLVANNIHPVAPTLLSLNLLSSNRMDQNLYPQPLDVQAIVPNSPLQFPRLRAFQCHLDSDGMTFVTRYWKYPALDTLACRPPSAYLLYNRLKSILQLNFTFIEEHGQKLITLLLQYPQEEVLPVRDARVQDLLAGLVHLRHLIIPASLDISVPQVQWLDCHLGRLDDQKENAGEKLPLLSVVERKNRFPNLKSYRSISPGLLRLPLIYTMLPPATEACQFSFPGIEIRSNASSLEGVSTAITDRDLDSAEIEDVDFSSGTGSDCDEFEPSSDSQLNSDSDDSEESQSADGSSFQSSDGWEADEMAALDLWQSLKLFESGLGQQD
ncbi:hypothetical protein J3R30DRAFT_1843487 [Lentinula aciculospora]|uniref:Uncharacterized protein n=1 Tax=Lentinula aciculospora TaxID=153920 RepID=A0A9W9AIY0_9AGAR|nr:hypothetical protein J3R30DRAFT_1843487 [Lentinula aciculospora]